MDAKKIGSFIAEKRKSKKMTQMQMGEKLGVTAKTISRWENGNYMPDISLLIPIAELLEITVDELLQGEGCTSNESTTAPLVSAIEYTAARRALLTKRYVYCFIIGIVVSVMVIFLMHMMLFQELGVSGTIIKEHLGFSDGGATMTEEMLKVVMVIMTAMVLGIP